jgi:arylsulfatase
LRRNKMENSSAKRSLMAGTGLALLATGHLTEAAETLPKPSAPFAGKIDISRDRSVPAWPEGVKAPKGAPNVVLILLDDTGFSAASTFGGAVATPELDRLAASGLRYNSFHVNALCSPTRATLLTGRNNHQVGFGSVSDNASGFPGYNSVWNKDMVSVAEVLRRNGYSTAAFGKWHNTPQWEISPVGPFDRWPTSLGFEYYYGFMAGADSQWQPRLWRNTVPVEPPATPEQNYHVTTDLTNDAVRWLHQHDALAQDKPFFLYFAPGATHSPHHAPQEWVDRYKGRFDQGWDKLREETFERQKKLGVIPATAELTPRPKELPAWDSLNGEQKKLMASQAEVFAGFLAHTDYEVGRLLKAIEEEGQADNTLVLYIVGDNGASAEGGLEGSYAGAAEGGPQGVEQHLKRVDDPSGELFTNNYAAAWAWATNTPFQWTKQVASHLGGTRNPLVVSWPSKIRDKGGVRGQFQHINDIAPTIYDVAGIRFPEKVDGVKQVPLEGTSLSYTFNNAAAPGSHTTQYFEMVGNRGIYKDGWWAGARHLLPWKRDAWETAEIGQHPWELYNLNEDYSQAHNLATKNPEKLQELVALFDSEAERNNVYPFIPRRGKQPSPADGKTTFTYREGVSRIPVRVAPNVSGRSHSITADIDVPERGAEGVIIAEGGRFGGFTLYVKDGRVIYESNSSGAIRDRIVSSVPLPTGKVRIVLDYIADAANAKPAADRKVKSGSGKLLVNGVAAGEARFAIYWGYSNETLDLGSDTGSPVSTDYVSPFAFTGKVDKVTIQLK